MAFAERFERFVGAVGGRTQTVGTEAAILSEKGDQRNLVEEMRILNIARAADQNVFEFIRVEASKRIGGGCFFVGTVVGHCRMKPCVPALLSARWQDFFQGSPGADAPNRDRPSICLRS